MRLEDFLRSSRAAAPDKIALVTDQRRLSFAEIDELSDRLAAHLRAAGLEPGERSVVFLDNCWEAVVAIFAIAKAGGVFSVVNPSTKADKLAYIIRNCRASILFCKEKLAPVAEAALAQTTSVKQTIVAGQPLKSVPSLSLATCLATERHPEPHDGIDLDLAMIVYTSGSTGRPKGVMMTHRNVEAAATSIITYLENTRDDVILNVLPIAFDYGLYQIIMAIKLGATLVLEKSFAFPTAVFQRMRDERVTGFPIVPTMAAMIFKMRDLKPGALPDLRYITNTAAALSPMHIVQLRDLFPGVRLYSMYGQTECKRCTWLSPDQLDKRPDSVGKAIPNTQAMVVDKDGQPVAPGVVGELVIRGPHVMQGYWEDEVATAKALRPGRYPWERVLYTGDLFRCDEEGFLYFVGRADEIIKTRGEKVAPKEVEAVIHTCPGVVEAVVVGVPDAVLGEAVCALVVAGDPALREADVIRHCAARLEDFMVPRLVEFRPSLPQTDTGKVSRKQAAELLIEDPSEAAQ